MGRRQVWAWKQAWTTQVAQATPEKPVNLPKITGGSWKWRITRAEIFQDIQTLLHLDYPSLLQQEKHQGLGLREREREVIQKVQRLKVYVCVYAQTYLSKIAKVSVYKFLSSDKNSSS